MIIITELQVLYPVFVENLFLTNRLNNINKNIMEFSKFTAFL